MNTITVIGRLARDNDLRYTKNGKAVIGNTLAVDDGFGDNKKTFWLPFVVWDKQAEAVANYTHKGSKVAIKGKLSSRQYENNEGKKVTVIEIVADMYGGVEFLDSKESSQQSYQPKTAEPVVVDDDLPF